jgi:DNA integrity scanning protein DisA with diadenylate cyclase activity
LANPAFKKGMQKVPGSGRKKGQLKKVTVARVREVLAEHGKNPTEEILKLIPYLEPEDQLKAWCFLIGFSEARPSEEEQNKLNKVAELADKLEKMSDEQLTKAITLGMKDVSGRKP